SRTIQKKYSGRIKEFILHTGQHYDENMSNVFFNELGIPRPDFTFSIKGKSIEEQLIEMENEITKVLLDLKPDCVIVYGDTNSTYAGAKAAFLNNIPLAHIEAGLRSWNNEMPEERNRVYADKVSSLMYTPTLAGLENLKNEGFKINNDPPYSIKNPKVYHCGDVMLDNSLHFSKLAEVNTNILRTHGLQNNQYILATVHRNTNTDNPDRLNAIFEAIFRICDDNTVILPLHPRTKKMLDVGLNEKNKLSLQSSTNLILCDPVSFLEMIALEKNCKLIITDSGGVQKEAFYFKKPCLVLREETEWVELIDCGAAILAGNSSVERIIKAYQRLIENPPKDFPDYYGNGNAAVFICDTLINNFS
ncbi:MAG: non-hydrolyzing UDP-N-acetylglucosamine 2-epimerase, partial [Bacteroidota bacterium]